MSLVSLLLYRGSGEIIKREEFDQRKQLAELARQERGRYDSRKHPRIPAGLALKMALDCYLAYFPGKATVC